MVYKSYKRILIWYSSPTPKCVDLCPWHFQKLPPKGQELNFLHPPSSEEKRNILLFCTNTNNPYGPLNYSHCDTQPDMPGPFLASPKKQSTQEVNLGP